VRRGKVYTAEAGARQCVTLNGQNWLKATTVELNAALRLAKIEPKTPLHEALKTLEHTAPM